MNKQEFRSLIREEIKNVLKEIGEGTAKPYEYKHVADTPYGIYYSFTTDPDPNKTFLGKPAPGTEYEVDLRFWDIQTSKPSSTNIDVAFSTHGGEYEEETNDNVQYRIMATVLAIVKETLKKHTEITTLTFTPAKASKVDDRRARFYKAYIEKQLPGSTTTMLKKGGFKIQLVK